MLSLLLLMHWPERPTYLKFLLNFLFLMGFGGILPAQNLIYNPGFESFTQLPKEGHGQFRYCFEHWSTPNGSFTDYYHAQSISPTVQVPWNNSGFQPPHSGKAYAGICVEQAEYIQAELKTPLVAGKQYCLRLFISRAESSVGYVRALGALLSRDKIQLDDQELLVDTPTVVFRQGSGYQDTAQWVCLSDTFVAQGGEKYLNFGYFGTTKLRRFTHYYIDDASLTLREKDVVCDCESDVTEFPLGELVVLENIFFAFDSADLLATSAPELDHIFSYLNSHPTLKMEILGHTDSLGGDVYNNALSSSRASAVRNHLIARGIDSNRLLARGFGRTRPITENTTRQGRQTNRRVEVRVVERF